MQQQQADGSYQELWPKNDSWNKTEVLSDLTRELLGLDSSSVPDDAFIALTIGTDSKAYRVKVTYPNGQPAVGFTVGGLTAFPALGLVTNASGIVMGSSTSSSPTITVAQKYDDVKSYSGSFISTRTITDCEIVLEWNETNNIYTSSQTVSYNCSDFVTKISYLIVAGRGGGGGSVNMMSGYLQSLGGGGGASGRDAVTGEFVWSKEDIILTVGSGGTSVQQSNPIDGGNGRTTTISIGEQTNSVSGGQGGNKVKSYSLVYGSSASVVGGDSSSRNGDGGQGRSGTGSYYQRNEDNPPIVNSATSSNGGNGTVGKTLDFYGESIETGGGGGGYFGYVYRAPSRTYGTSFAKPYRGGGDGNVPNGMSDGNYKGHPKGYDGVVIIRLIH